MKKRIFNVLNFFAFNVLFFAIYLNFIHKDVNTLPAVSASGHEAVKNITSTDFKHPALAATQQNTKAANAHN